jgi:hypothetical protein
MTNGTNGHDHTNGHNKPISEESQPEAEAELEKSKPCCARMEDGNWCTRPDSHEGPHEGPPPRYGPLAPPAWEMQKRRFWADKVAHIERAVEQGKMTRAEADEEIRVSWLFVSKGGVSRSR